MPGCDHVFTGRGDQSVLDQVLAHAAAEHGLIAPPLSFIELVLTHTRPFALTRIPGGAVGRTPDERPAHAELSTISTNPFRSNPVLGGKARPPRRPQLIPNQPGRSHETYRHECLLYAGSQGFLDAVVPFVRDGLARSEPVMIAVAEPRQVALRTALGANAERVMFADMTDLGHKPALIIPAWREFTERYSGTGRPVRGVGEPIWANRQPAEIAEAQLREALLNVAVSPDVPLWLLCPYDTSTLDDEVLTEAHRSHPVVFETAAYRGSAQYGGAAHVEEFFGTPLPEPGTTATSIAFDPDGHSHVQGFLRVASHAGLPLARAVRLAAAIDEIACAAYQETAYAGLRTWTERGALICEVADPGEVRNPMIGRGAGPDDLRPRSRALWLANELADLVQVRSGLTGTTTRILCWL